MSARQDLTHKERTEIIDLLIHMSHLTTHISDTKTMIALCDWTTSTAPERGGMLIAFARDTDPGWFRRTLIDVLKHRHQRAPRPGIRILK